MNTVKRFLKTLLFFLLLQIQSSSSSDSITPQHSIKDGDVVVSPGKIFAFGFFSPVNSTFRYVGIWYYQVTKQTVVWVGNREKPINDTNGVVSIDTQGNLVLHRQNQTDPVWSTNIASFWHSNNSIARLYDSGNLVLIQDGTHLLWQSFYYPTNILIPSMKLGLNRRTGLNRFQTSWKSVNDPGIGIYSVRIDPTGFPQLYLYKDSAKVFRFGSWTGQRWSGTPEMGRVLKLVNSSFVNDNEEIVFMIGVSDPSIISILVLTESGAAQRITWNPEEQHWIPMASNHQDDCDGYRHCGPNSNCDITQVEKKCSCLPGFEPKSPESWSLGEGEAGCIRKPNASICQHGEGFVKVVHVKVPDTGVANAEMSLGLKQCKDKCLRDCSCRGYASAYYENTNGGTGCLTWHGDLLDMRTFADVGQDFYVRVDAVDLARYRKNGKHYSRKLMVTISLVSVAVVFCMAASALCFLKTIRQARNRRVSKSSLITFTANSTSLRESFNERNAELPAFDLGTIAAATNNFSADNKLGKGGFGHVYKGSLKGEEIAVKRLSKSSGQGIEEFKNEITLIAKLQHRNLVRILGCCVDREEKMLIYEYMPNKSLDSFIFDERKRSLLDWGRRREIIYGIARGIAYLHQDSRLRIVHRDLKASNILLDVEMNPKISDFGMARIFGGNQIEADTNRVVGTYGYMAPEYAMQGHFSIKSDVYSFGVLLLEVITGRRNSGSYPESPTLNLIGHVWELWRNGKAEEIIDSSTGNSYPRDEVLRCIEIGLLCVQESAADRPKMSAVVAMFENDASLPSPKPKQPAFIIRNKKPQQGDETGSSEGTASINGVTVTHTILLQGR